MSVVCQSYARCVSLIPGVSVSCQVCQSHARCVSGVSVSCQATCQFHVPDMSLHLGYDWHKTDTPGMRLTHLAWQCLCGEGVLKNDN